MAEEYKILSLNVGNGTTLGGLLSILSLENPHVVMLQEITLSSEQLTLLVNKYGYKAETNIDIHNQNTMGTGFVWKTTLPVNEVYSVIHCRGQLLKLGRYSFVNIYAPSGSQNKQSRRIFFGQDVFRVMRSVDKTLPILGGDFNCVLTAKDTEKNFFDKKCSALKELVENFNYSDAYRLLNPIGEDFTFCRPSCAASRLDRFYVPQYLAGGVKSVTHHASLADHKYVVMKITLPDITNKPEPTMSNTSIVSTKCKVLQLIQK